MSGATTSITRRITLSVLLLELLAAVVLIATVTNHERVVRFEALDANLRAMSNALLGSVQEAETESGSVKLDTRSMSLPAEAVYRVSADAGQILGSQGAAAPSPSGTGSTEHANIAGRPYRFYVLRGERIIDPDSPRAVNHHVTVIYGVPERSTWHAIFEATRFVAIATVVLLGITAFLMSWLVRRFLLPIRELALQAGRINANHWIFESPANSQRFEELAPLATAMEKTVARLHTAFEQQQRFTSDAAHELKTDVAIIKSSVQLLTMKQRSLAEYEQGLMLSLADIARLEGTVQKMLALARLEQSAPERDEACDLVRALRDAIAQSQPVASVKQITLHNHLPPGPANVCLSLEDATLLCANVLMNALQHSPVSANVAVTLRNEASDAVLVFRDHGEGITEADRPFLFDAFYRGDTSRSRKSGGTGLGLSICKAICDRAHGSISIRNHADGGAEVSITLPRCSGLRAA